MSTFCEYDEKGNDVMDFLENAMCQAEEQYGINFAEPKHDIARWFLYYIKEFTPMEEKNERRR